MPKNKSFDLSSIYIKISVKTFNIVQTTSYNQYQDKIVIDFLNIQFHNNLKDDLFNFEIPEGSEIDNLEF